VSANLVHQLQASLRAKELYKKDKDYIIDKGQVKIVDEFTGRVLDGRRWSDGLHQAVEAKEGVSIKEENQTLATITLQNYYRLYERLAGMTGTAETEAAEFVSTYGLHVIPVPTNRPLTRLDEGDLIYKTEDAKFTACVDDLFEKHETGQPVLVGTVSVEKSEKLSRELEKRGIPHEVLNAKQHTREAEVVAQAGRLGSITVATNMAGRGVDILLGGNPEGLAERDVRADGLELDSDDGQKRYDERLAAHTKITEDEKQKVLDLGGLYVLGTERHESRRIDNQLRGRSGRQGDPGESRFYLSLEDELMRLFATGAMNWVMDRALPDDVPIEAKMVTKAIERAQNTVEARNAETRKNVLKYDEVMNEQRKVIYKRRSQILDGADLRDKALEYLSDAIEDAVSTCCVSEIIEEWDLEGLATEINTLWPGEVKMIELGNCRTIDELEHILWEEGASLYEVREKELGEEVMRQVERQVMLRIIDQRWREHLKEMDLLREGIHLRAMGQRDPATEWQREGFDMFGQMMTGIALDFVKYVMHVQVAVQNAPADDEQQLSGVTEQKQYAAAGTPATEIPDAGAPQVAQATEAPSNTPIVKSDLEKVGRNEPCPCGSGKKYKACHGRPGAAG
jgi:preprotein translocase subunit SecA